MKHIYIIVSQTGTILSRLLKSITHSEYNHSSISLNQNLYPMYSFGRLNPYNPVWGGFVLESIHHGTFRRFKNTEAIILKVPVEKSVYEAIKEQMSDMYRNRYRYTYNYLGLVLAGINVNWTQGDAFYCSEFVKDVLIRYRINGYEKLMGIVHPMQFLDLPDAEVIYTGKLRDFKYAQKTELIKNRNDFRLAVNMAGDRRSRR